MSSCPGKRNQPLDSTNLHAVAAALDIGLHGFPIDLHATTAALDGDLCRLPIDLRVGAAALDKDHPRKTLVTTSCRERSTRPSADVPHMSVSRATIPENLRSTTASFAVPIV
jgi:hypothetical protein